MLADVALAVTEAVSNSIVHAFVGRTPGTVRTEIRARRDEFVVIVTDDGRGMQPRTDSPGLGLGLPTIGRLSATMDVHAPEDGGTVLTMTFAAPGVRGPERPGAVDEAELLDAVARTVDGAWPEEGVERLVDLLVPGLADACALDVIGDDGRPERFAGRIHGPDGARQSAWLAVAAPAHRGAAVRHPRGAGRRRAARRRAHPGAHRPHHLRAGRRRADDGDGHPVVGRDPADRRRAPARADALRDAPGPRPAAARAARPAAVGRRSRGAGPGRQGADHGAAADPPALRAHPRRARRGGHRPGRRRPPGLRQRGRDAHGRRRRARAPARRSSPRASTSPAPTAPRSASRTCPATGCSPASTPRPCSPARCGATPARRAGC